MPPNKRSLHITQERLSEPCAKPEPEPSISPLQYGPVGQRKFDKKAYDRARYLARRDALLPALRATYDPIEGRRKNLWSKFRITPEEYDAMLLKQEGRCGICGTDQPRGRWGCFAVDHDHTTGKIRGLLCNGCNAAIGALGDTEHALLRALKYIRGKSWLILRTLRRRRAPRS